MQGGCFGGGTGIVAACDILVAAEDAIFSITEARWGLMAGIILPQLCRAIGVRNLRRYALSCERLCAQEALRIGFAHEICKVEELDAIGVRIVETLLMNAPGATASTKLRTLRIADAFIDDGLLRDLVQEHAVARQSAEAAEGTASFLQKRRRLRPPDDRPR